MKNSYENSYWGLFQKVDVMKPRKNVQKIAAFSFYESRMVETLNFTKKKLLHKYFLRILTRF